MPEQYNQEGMVHNLQAQLVVVMLWGQGFIIVYNITSELSFRCAQYACTCPEQHKNNCLRIRSVAYIQQRMLSSVCSVAYVQQYMLQYMLSSVLQA